MWSAAPNQALQRTRAAKPARAAELGRSAAEGYPRLELVFGTREGDHLRFEVLGPTCPDATDDWYRAQLDADIHIRVGTFRGFRSLVMFSDDFHLFRERLDRLASRAAGTATLETGDFLSVDVSSVAGGYTVWMQLDALEQDGEPVLLDGGAENWEWRVAIDRAALEALTAAVTRVSERYPTWSVPRG